MTDMLERVIESLAQVVHLPSCPLVLVCDGYRDAKASTWKAGRVDVAGATAYNEYLERLVELVEAGSPRLGTAPVTLLLLEGRHGQALAVKAGLEHVATELVLVHQHDILFMVGFDLRAVCAALVRGGRTARSTGAGADAGADVGEGARWTADRQTAFRRRDGKPVEEISLK